MNDPEVIQEIVSALNKIAQAEKDLQEIIRTRIGVNGDVRYSRNGVHDGFVTGLSPYILDEIAVQNTNTGKGYRIPISYLVDENDVPIYMIKNAMMN